MIHTVSVIQNKLSSFATDIFFQTRYLKSTGMTLCLLQVIVKKTHS